MWMISRSSIEALLHSLKTIEESIRKLDKILSEQGRKDEDCKLLTTVPGVGVIVAMTYKAAIDDPYRFETSYTVGAYMGLSPRQYASGEVDRHDETSEEELEKIIGSDVIIKKAYEELNRFNWSEKEFIAYEQEIKRIRDERAVLEQKLDDAKKEGKIEVAKTMLANNVDVTTIVKFTGLSMSEIKELQN
ncbi:uncharacterized protein TNCT_110921 [Trichonephila clavata]|uniref:Transposase IS116/IS110/IS902 C-terminal domain-containing protein n=1 Tax=Trichonephila clavata TaxID=2740835 RepID=A0A8X6HAD9_TRICU|nr:uncharacterized protein TNCT_110921 [Trichonephila clavata]